MKRAPAHGRLVKLARTSSQERVRPQSQAVVTCPCGHSCLRAHPDSQIPRRQGHQNNCCIVWSGGTRRKCFLFKMSLQTRIPKPWTKCHTKKSCQPNQQLELEFLTGEINISKRSDMLDSVPDGCVCGA